MSNLSRYWKTVVAVVGALLVIGNSVLAAVDDGYGDGKWGTEDTLAVVIALLTVLGVYAKANTTPAGKAPDPNVSEVGPGETL